MSGLKQHIRMIRLVRERTIKGAGRRGGIRALRSCLAAVGVGLSAVAFAAPSPAGAKGAVPLAQPEQRLVTAIDAMRQGQLDKALQVTRALIKAQPNFHLAQLIYGDLLVAKAGRAPSSLRPEHSAELRGLIQEANLRLAQAQLSPPAGYVPNAVLALAPWQKYAIVVDLARARLYVLRNDNGEPRVVLSMYASIGKNGAGKKVAGDKRTPIGVYHTTKFLPGSKLPGIYGKGAFPLNYPNAWDRRAGRTGYGIWLHGVPGNTYTRLPHASLGCVAVANPNLLSLKSYITPDVTPVVFSDHLVWESKPQALQQRDNFLLALEKWRQDWESGDVDAYLSHYAHDFTTDGLNYRQFAREKHKVDKRKSFIHVKLTGLSLFHYPGGSHLMMVTFTQHYVSNDYTKVTRKRQFWHRNAKGQWRIVYADTPPSPGKQTFSSHMSARLTDDVFGTPAGSTGGG